MRLGRNLECILIIFNSKLLFCTIVHSFSFFTSRFISSIFLDSPIIVFENYFTISWIEYVLLVIAIFRKRNCNVKSVLTIEFIIIGIEHIIYCRQNINIFPFEQHISLLISEANDGNRKQNWTYLTKDRLFDFVMPSIDSQVELFSKLVHTFNLVKKASKNFESFNSRFASSLPYRWVWRWLSYIIPTSPKPWVITSF